jgi:hypothetical protein
VNSRAIQGGGDGQHTVEVVALLSNTAIQTYFATTKTLTLSAGRTKNEDGVPETQDERDQSVWKSS